MPYLRKRSFNSAVKQLRSIAAALGEVRDQDVSIMALEEIEKHAPPAASGALKQFIETRKQLREQAREELKSILDEIELKELESEFFGAVEKATASSERNNKRTPPELSFREISQAVIVARLKESEKLSNGLFQPLDAGGLHEMRIAVKRLRYAIELFGGCWPRSMSTYAKRAARIQTALGDLHDCDVWTTILGKQIIQARKQKDQEQVTGLLWLLGHFIKLRTKHLRRALARWREWEAHDTSGKLRAALRPKVDQPAGEQV
jgi:CHAD domain-containing protein